MNKFELTRADKTGLRPISLMTQNSMLFRDEDWKNSNNPLKEDPELQKALFLSYQQSINDEILHNAREQSIDDEMERMRIFYEMEKQKMEYEFLAEEFYQDAYITFWEDYDEF